MRGGFQKRIKEARKKLGLTQADIALKLNISRGAYGNIEAGYQNPSYDVLELIGTVYNISLDWLLFGRGLMFLLPEDHVLNNLSDEWCQIIEAVESTPESDKDELLQSMAQNVRLYRKGRTQS